MHPKKMSAGRLARRRVEEAAAQLCDQDDFQPIRLPEGVSLVGMHRTKAIETIEAHNTGFQIMVNDFREQYPYCGARIAAEAASILWKTPKQLRHPLSMLIHLLLVVSVGLAAQDYYVSTNGGDHKLGTSWAEAMLTLDKVVQVASSSEPLRIFIDEGTYTFTADTRFETNLAVSLYGKQGDQPPTVDCGGFETFWVPGGSENPPLSITNLALTRCKLALHNWGDVQLQNAVFDNPWSSEAMLMEAAASQGDQFTLNATGCVFRDISMGVGGAVFSLLRYQVFFTQCVFENITGWAPVINVEDSTLYVTSCGLTSAGNSTVFASLVGSEASIDTFIGTELAHQTGLIHLQGSSSAFISDVFWETTGIPAARDAEVNLIRMTENTTLTGIDVVALNSTAIRGFNATLELRGLQMEDDMGTQSLVVMEGGSLNIVDSFVVSSPIAGGQTAAMYLAESVNANLIRTNLTVNQASVALYVDTDGGVAVTECMLYGYRSLRITKGDVLVNSSTLFSSDVTVSNMAAVHFIACKWDISAAIARLQLSPLSCMSSTAVVRMERMEFDIGLSTIAPFLLGAGCTLILDEVMVSNFGGPLIKVVETFSLFVTDSVVYSNSGPQTATLVGETGVSGQVHVSRSIFRGSWRHFSILKTTSELVMCDVILDQVFCTLQPFLDISGPTKSNPTSHNLTNLAVINSSLKHFALVTYAELHCQDVDMDDATTMSGRIYSVLAEGLLTIVRGSYHSDSTLGWLAWANYGGKVNMPAIIGSSEYPLMCKDCCAVGEEDALVAKVFDFWTSVTEQTFTLWQLHLHVDFNCSIPVPFMANISINGDFYTTESVEVGDGIHSVDISRADLTLGENEVSSIFFVTTLSTNTFVVGNHSLQIVMDEVGQGICSFDVLHNYDLAPMQDTLCSEYVYKLEPLCVNATWQSWKIWEESYSEEMPQFTRGGNEQCGEIVLFYVIDGGPRANLTLPVCYVGPLSQEIGVSFSNTSTVKLFDVVSAIVQPPVHATELVQSYKLNGQSTSTTVFTVSETGMYEFCVTIDDMCSQQQIKCADVFVSNAVNETVACALDSQNGDPLELLLFLQNVASEPTGTCGNFSISTLVVTLVSNLSIANEIPSVPEYLNAALTALSLSAPLPQNVTYAAQNAPSPPRAALFNQILTQRVNESAGMPPVEDNIISSCFQFADSAVAGALDGVVVAADAVHTVDLTSKTPLVGASGPISTSFQGEHVAIIVSSGSAAGMTGSVAGAGFQLPHQLAGNASVLGAVIPSQLFPSHQDEEMEFLGPAVSLSVSEPVSQGGNAISSFPDDPIAITLPITQVLPDRTEPGCFWFNEMSETWEASGCVREQFSQDTVTCSCNHLTVFSSMPVPEDDVPSEPAEPGGGDNNMLLFTALFIVVFVSSAGVAVRNGMAQKHVMDEAGEIEFVANPMIAKRFMAVDDPETAIELEEVDWDRVGAQGNGNGGFKFDDKYKMFNVDYNAADEVEHGEDNGDNEGYYDEMGEYHRR